MPFACKEFESFRDCEVCVKWYAGFGDPEVCVVYKCFAFALAGDPISGACCEEARSHRDIEGREESEMNCKPDGWATGASLHNSVEVAEKDKEAVAGVPGSWTEVFAVGVTIETGRDSVCTTDPELHCTESGKHHFNCWKGNAKPSAASHTITWDDAIIAALGIVVEHG